MTRHSKQFAALGILILALIPAVYAVYTPAASAAPITTAAGAAEHQDR